MKYEIQGGNFPVLVCNLQNEECIITREQNMSWMSPNIVVDTVERPRGARSFFSENPIMNTRYTSVGGFGTIAFASTLPGKIIALQLDGTKDYICQRTSILASTLKVTIEKYLNEKVDTNIFGKDGYVMERVSGQGVIFLEVGGSVVDYPLQEDQQIIVETGRVVMASGTCEIKLVEQRDLIDKTKTVYNTVVTGPGVVVLQTIPPSKITQEIQKRSRM